MKRYLVALPVLFVLYIIFLSVMPTFLSLNQRLESKTLIIESWISPYETELALPLIGSDSIERIFIIGALYPEDREHFLSVCEDYFKKQSDKNADINSGVWMLTNSALCFNGDNFRSIPGGDSIKITVRARSSSDFKYHAHFNLILNGQF
ncbi:MAG: hypothetical protein FJY07_01385, partial [Bacteroidetes bacterium]|nr:hypothetical protein [Bacteroidota bacterium]